MDSLAVPGQVSDSFTYTSSEAGAFEVKVLVADGRDYSTRKWAVTVEEGQSFGITGAAVGVVSEGGSSLLSWLRGLF
ncbi:MAG: hypothetical protein Q8N77_02395 [Nanoarchaeota archaeon]|nr:hypothetical protein [Nanoarchaeota archaeon]